MSNESREDQYFRGFEIVRKMMGEISNKLETTIISQQNSATNFKNYNAEFSRVRNDVENIKTRMTIAETNASSANIEKLREDVTKLSTNVILLENKAMQFSELRETTKELEKRLSALETKKDGGRELSKEDAKTIIDLKDRLTKLESTNVTEEDKKNVKALDKRLTVMETKMSEKAKGWDKILWWVALAVPTAIGIAGLLK